MSQISFSNSGLNSPSPRIISWVSGYFLLSLIKLWIMSDWFLMGLRRPTLINVNFLFSKRALYSAGSSAFCFSFISSRLSPLGIICTFSAGILKFCVSCCLSWLVSTVIVSANLYRCLIHKRYSPLPYAAILWWIDTIIFESLPKRRLMIVGMLASSIREITVLILCSLQNFLIFKALVNNFFILPKNEEVWSSFRV